MLFPVPDEMEDEPLESVEVGSAQLIDDGIHSPDHLPFVLQTWKEKRKCRIISLI